MKDNCLLDLGIGALTSKYPFVKNPTVLEDNGAPALTYQKKQVQHQTKIGTHSQYIEQFKDMINRKVVSPISTAELSTHSGPVNYVSHHEVHKDSQTTPIQLVSNSSLKMDPII